jgi:hypothetical protein
MNGLLKTTRTNLSFSDRLRRNRHSDRIPTKALPKRESFLFEPLESRLLLSVTLAGVPDWVDQGPGSDVQAGSAVPQNNAVSGAVQSIAVNPNNSSQIIVGTVDGGVWRTTNANTATPMGITWTPLMDQLASLAIGAVAYDPADATGNTFYAGTGLFSNSFDTGGTAIGLYRTTNAGATWTLLGDDVTGTNILAGNRIKSIAVDGQTILVGTIGGTGIGNVERPGDASRNYATLGGGLYRSTDGGATFTLDLGTAANPLPAGAVPSVVVDPNNAQRVFAAVAGQGVFRSEDGGASWNAFSTGLTGAATSADIELAVQNIGGTTTLFGGVSRTGTVTGATNAAPILITSNNHGLQTGDPVVMSNVGGNTAANGSFTITVVNANQFSLDGSAGNGAFSSNGTWQSVRVFSANNFTGGGNWAGLAVSPLGLNPGAAFGEKFQLAADPTNAGVVYLDGEGGSGIFRYNPAGAGSWVQIDASGAQGTGPHADSRDMVFLGNNTLLEADDGGIFFIQNPTNAATSSWNSFNGDLRTFEFYSVAYDPTNQVVIAGAQDNAVAYQNATNSLSWTSFLAGDGNTEAVDSTSLGGGNVFRYSLNNNLDNVNFNNFTSGIQRLQFTNTNAQVTPQGTAGLVTGATNAAPIVITSNNHGLLNGDQVFIGGVQGNTAANFNTSVAITVIDANHFSLNGSTGNGTYLGGGSWQRLSVITNASGAAGNPVVITTANNHRLNSGDEIFIPPTGSGGLTGTYAGLNGSSYYVTVTDATHFTLNGTAADGTTAAGGFYRISHSVMLKTAIGAANLSGLNAADRGFNSFLPIPFVLNSVDPRMMMLGLTGLYEDADTTAPNGFAGDVITDISANAVGLGGNLGTGAGLISAMAYGGSRGGTGFTNVAVVGDSSGGLWFRGETGTAFTNITAQIGTGGFIDSIALDPQDWRRVYVVSNNQVFFTADITTLGANPFQVIGGGINDNLNSLTTQLRSVEVVGSTPVVGGLGGAFRKIGAVWSEYGQALPNTVVRDLQYNATDDVLVAGTFGRGAWTVANASATIGVVGVLQIDGDTDFPGEDDTIRLVIDGNNSSLLDVFLNGALSQFQLSTIQQINVNSLGGHDTLIVDSSNGLITVVNGIRYDGGDFFDNLQLVQTGGATQAGDTYSVGPAIGSGVSRIVGAGTQTVFFEDLEPVVDLVPAALLTVNATATDNAINYSAGSLVTRGLVTIDEHESIAFANKTALTINAGAGQDTISLNNPNTPTGLTGITVNGGDPSGGDTLNITGVGVGSVVSVNTAASTISGATGAGGAVSIGYGGIENLNLLTGIGDLTLTTTAADDTVVVAPGLTTGANSGTVQSSGAVPQIAFVNSGTFTANLGDGDDALVVNGSSNTLLGDIVDVSGTAVAISGRRTVNYTGVQALTVNGNAGSDTFNVTPSLTVAMFIDGGDPIGVKPGDLLNIIAGGSSVTFNAGPETDEGGFVVGANQPVSFDHIESLGITGGGPAVINGTNGPDAITVIARDDTYAAAADGVQDFTVSVNIGPELLFIDVASLTIDALSGSDQVTLVTPAPNNAVWDVDVTVNGGPPAADTDRLIVQTPGAAAETVVYTPTASDGGTLNLTSLSSLVTINTIEVLSYDGQGDNDSLTIVGTGGADTIVHTPGATDQAGSFQVNSLLALSYQNLGSGGSLTADGGGDTDTLVYNGTNANDSFTIDGSGAGGGAGQVTLNSRPVLNTTNVEILTLEGLNGDDTFTLNPAISASVYFTINLNGGGQASVGGDRVVLFGTGGDDDILVNGPAISLGGKTINTSGIENINLDALGGTDRITYNGVSGVTENITVSGSSTVGSGQISVPGVTLINFSSVDGIVVNGNPPTATETDTLTFAGTNAVDTFNINLAAVGTSGDPVLRLDNNGTTLLTLENYTNFNTLRVLGLDGADTFNVFTAASTTPPDPTFQGRNLFVDGGTPTGKKKSTDNLNVFYTPPRPSIIHSTATQDPDAGIVDLDYNTARFVVQYDDIEQVVIRRR